MPQFWIAIFFILLAIAQLYESIKDIDLPLPVYLVLGTILAVAANSPQQFSASVDRPAALSLPQIVDPVLSYPQPKLLAAMEPEDPQPSGLSEGGTSTPAIDKRQRD